MSEVIRRQEYATADPSRVRELLGRAYGTRVHLLAVAPGATMRHVRYDAGCFSVSQTAVPGRLSYACDPGGVVSVTELTAAGRPILRARCGATQVFETRNAQIRQLTIGAELLDRVAAANGRASVEFRGFQPPTEALARLWRQTAGYVAHVVCSPSADNRLVVASAARTMAAAVLMCFPNTVRTRRDEAGPADGLVRRAVAFVDENFDRDIGVGDIAEAIHVTPRAVQLMFRRHLGTTPTGYLRRVRLDHAHRDLVRADPASATVSEIAARWGFAHAGRFSALYRQTYNRGPYATLRGG